MREKLFKGTASNPYGFRWWNQDGKQHQRTFATLREREAFKQELSDAPAETTGGDETFGSYATRWIDQNEASKADNTTLGYRSLMRVHILPAIGHIALKDLTRETVKRLVLETIPSPSSAQCVHKLITAVLNEAIKDERVRHNVAKAIKMPYGREGKRVEIIPVTYDQLVTIAGAMPDKWALSIWIGYGCGFRPGEILAVRHDSLRENGTMLRTEEQVHMRYRADKPSLVPMKARLEGEYRDVPCPEWLSQKIEEHCQRFGIGPTDYLFPDFTEQRDTGAWRNCFACGRDRAGLPKDFIPYQLRHHFASVTLANGIAMPDLGRWMGHKRIQTTYDYYAHLMPASVMKARDAQDKAFAEFSASAM